MTFGFRNISYICTNGRGYRLKFTTFHCGNLATFTSVRVKLMCICVWACGLFHKPQIHNFLTHVVLISVDIFCFFFVPFIEFSLKLLYFSIVLGGRSIPLTRFWCVSFKIYTEIVFDENVCCLLRKLRPISTFTIEKQNS